MSLDSKSTVAFWATRALSSLTCSASLRANARRTTGRAIHPEDKTSATISRHRTVALSLTLEGKPDGRVNEGFDAAGGRRGDVRPGEHLD